LFDSAVATVSQAEADYNGGLSSYLYLASFSSQGNHSSSLSAGSFLFGRFGVFVVVGLRIYE